MTSPHAADEGTVGQRDDACRVRQRLSQVVGGRIAIEAGFEGRARAEPVCVNSQRSVGEHGEQHAAGTGAEQRAQQTGRVATATATGVVGDVGQDQPLTSARAGLDVVAGAAGARAARAADPGRAAPRRGTGHLTRAAAHAVGDGGRVAGVDLSGQMVAAALQRTPPEQAPRLSFLRMDGESLAWPDAHFDVVLCALGLMVMPDPVQALARYLQALAGWRHGAGYHVPAEFVVLAAARR